MVKEWLESLRPTVVPITQNDVYTDMQVNNDIRVDVVMPEVNVNVEPVTVHGLTAHNYFAGIALRKALHDRGIDLTEADLKEVVRKSLRVADAMVENYSVL